MAKKNINKEDKAGKEKKTKKPKESSAKAGKKQQEEKLFLDKTEEIQNEEFQTVKETEESVFKEIPIPEEVFEEKILSEPEINNEQEVSEYIPVESKVIPEELVKEPVEEKISEIIEEKSQEQEVVENKTPEPVEEFIKEEIKENITEPVEEIVPEEVEEKRHETVEEITSEKSDEKTLGIIKENIPEEESAEEKSAEEFKEQESVKQPEVIFPKSNYQISLINENLLRIIVETEKAVGVDCLVKSKKPADGDSKQTQSNKILIHPKEDGKSQEVEIIVSINKAEGVKIIEKQDSSLQPESTDEELTDVAEESGEKHPKKFLIDPSVRDLVVDEAAKKEILEQYKPKTREEYFEDKLIPGKNRFVINRKIIEKNLKIGIVTSLIILMFAMIVYSGVTMTDDTGEEQKNQRLIVIQDIPEMKVDIPMEEKKEETDDSKTIVTPKINIRRSSIKTPKIEITKKDTTQKSDSTEIAKNNEELDKLRRGDTTNVGTTVSGINSTDTVNANAVTLPFGQFGWTLIDSLDYGGRKFKFSSDTSQVIKDPSEIGKVSDFKMFVIQDIKGTEFSCGKNLRDFPVRIPEYKALKCEPREGIISNQTEYMYRISNGDNSYAVTIKVEYKKEYKPEYSAKVDSLIYYIGLPVVPK